MPTKNQGFVLVTSVLILTTLLMVGSYLISSATSENKIAQAEFLATKNYYLSEAGISEMLWRIKNDETTRNAFLAGALDASYDIGRSNVFGDSKAGYQVSARNTVTAEAWVTATSTYQIGNNISQRVVKSYISRATGDPIGWNYSVYSGGRGGQQNGNFTFTGSGVALIANGGRLHANQVFKVQKAEVIVNDGAVTSANVITVVSGGALTLNNSYQDAPTSTVEIIPITINSDPENPGGNSWENRATATFSTATFNSLPDSTVLTGIIYVNGGNARIINKNMTINGVLAVSGSLEVDLDGQSLAINHDETYGSGILVNNNLTITTEGGLVLIDGLVYSGNTLEINSQSTDFTINGGVAGFDAIITASGLPLILNFTPANIEPVIEPEYNPESPLIQIDHWEEQY